MNFVGDFCLNNLFIGDFLVAKQPNPHLLHFEVVLLPLPIVILSPSFQAILLWSFVKVNLFVPSSPK